MHITKRGELALRGGEPVRTRPWPDWPASGRQEERRLLRVLRSGRWARDQGWEVELFERRFAGMHGCRHGIALVSGMAALRLALRAAGLEAGSQIILPAYSPVALGAAVVELNLVPVFADVEPASATMSLQQVEAVAGERTRAVVALHLGGVPAEMGPLRERAAESGWLLIECAEHAAGAQYQGRPCGSWGDLAVFMFSGRTSLSAGDGGLVLTNHDTLAARARALQNCTRSPAEAPDPPELLAGCEAMTEFQAAVLNGQLDRFESQAKRRDQRSRYLAERLVQLPGLHPQQRTTGCTRQGDGGFAIRVDPDEFGVSREALVLALNAEGIPCSKGRALFLPQLPALRRRDLGPFLPGSLREGSFTRGTFPQAQKWSRQALWLEPRLLLADQRDLDDIVRALEKIHRQRQQLREWMRQRVASGRLAPS